MSISVKFTIPGVTKSEPNTRGHWAVKAKRNEAGRRKAMTLCPKWPHGPLLRITLCRQAPRELDGDNLQGALKATRDGIAARLRVDDGSKLIEWGYGQKTCLKGEEAVVVSFEVLKPEAHE